MSIFFYTNKCFWIPHDNQNGIVSLVDPPIEDNGWKTVELNEGELHYNFTAYNRSIYNERASKLAKFKIFGDCFISTSTRHFRDDKVLQQHLDQLPFVAKSILG